MGSYLYRDISLFFGRTAFSGFSLLLGNRGDGEFGLAFGRFGRGLGSRRTVRL